MFLLWALMAPLTSAQIIGAGGRPIQIYGMVQVEPGSNVITLGVKNEEIRFAVHEVRSYDDRSLTARFLSDTKRRTPGVYVKGPGMLLEALIKEEPGKRMLRLSGLYYPDSHVLNLNGLQPIHQKPEQGF